MREQQEEGEPSFDGGAVAEVKTYLEHKIYFFPALQMRIFFLPLRSCLAAWSRTSRGRGACKDTLFSNYEIRGVSPIIDIKNHYLSFLFYTTTTVTSGSTITTTTSTTTFTLISCTPASGVSLCG